MRELTVRDIIRPAAAEEVRARLGDSLAYVGRLRDRLTWRGCPADEQLLVELHAAYKALHAACTHLHYLSCTSGVAAGGSLPPLLVLPMQAQAPVATDTTSLPRGGDTT